VNGANATLGAQPRALGPTLSKCQIRLLRAVHYPSRRRLSGVSLQPSPPRPVARAEVVPTHPAKVETLFSSRFPPPRPRRRGRRARLLLA